MNVTYKTKKVDFSKIPIGQTFEFDEVVYIRIRVDEPDVFNTVVLTGSNVGYKSRFRDTDRVTPAEFELREV